VGVCVGFTVGVCVGFTVGICVGFTVGVCVGFTVGVCVGVLDEELELHPVMAAAATARRSAFRKASLCCASWLPPVAR